MAHRCVPAIATFIILLALAAPANAQQPEWQIEDATEIDDVFPGLYVAFDIATHNEHQFVAYYDDQRQMTIAQRQLDSDDWTYTQLDERAGWDSHNYVTIDVDDDGYIHVSGNMHNDRLAYFRSTEPLNLDSLERQFPMVDPDSEGRVTYPEFLRGPEGRFVFSYRDGGSGDGNTIYNAYDHDAGQWSRLFDRPLLDGQGRYNAYPVGPDVGPDGFAHLVWVWRDTPDAATNHTLSYARSPDLVNWQHADGTPVELPMTIETADVVDPVESGHGMINNNTHVGFDAQDRALVAYHKFDDAGNTQLHIARHEGDGWQVYQASQWTDFRWDFGGGGTLDFELTLSPPRPGPNGTVILDYTRLDTGQGRLILDVQSLQLIEDIPRPIQYAPDITDVRSDFPDMRVRTHPETLGSEERYLLRWETVPENRDQPRDADEYPAQPSTLQVYHLTR